MMQYWLAGFFLGNFWSLWCQESFWEGRGRAACVVGAMILIVVVRSLSVRVKKCAALGFLGLIWGFHGSKGLDEKDYLPGEAVLLSDSNMAGVAIIQLGSHKSFTGNGRGNEGDLVVPRCWANERLTFIFGKWSCGFRTITGLEERRFVRAHHADWISQRLRKVIPDKRVFPWIESLVLGKRIENFQFQSVIRDAGLVHIFVVSGMHVGCFGAVIYFLLIFPARLAYLMNVMEFSWYKLMHECASMISLGAIWWYVLVIPPSFPSLRASLSYSVFCLSPLFFGRVPVGRRFLFCLCLQALVVPDGFFCRSALLSWSALLIVVATSIKYQKRKCRWLISPFLIWLQISVVLFNINGRWNIGSMVSSMVGAPLFAVVFPVLICFLLLTFLFDHPGIDRAIWTCLDFLFNEVLVIFAEYSRETILVSGLYDWAHGDVLYLFSFFFFGVIILNCCRILHQASEAENGAVLAKE